MDPNNGLLGDIYTWCIRILEVVVLLVKIFVTNLHGFYQAIIPPEEKSVVGEIVLITGTGHGIGKELAKQYGALGAVVVCVDLNGATNEETVKELKSSGIRAFGFSCDVSKRDEVVNLGNRVRSDVGDVSILVNNAGIMPCKRFVDHTPEDITKLFNINVMAHYWMLEQFLPKMIEQNSGHIVGISSVLGLSGVPNATPYSSTKFAVRGLMESLREEFRHEGRNINFTTIYPYMVDTGLCKKAHVKYPDLLRTQTPQGTASEIIKAQRRGYKEHTVPGHMLLLSKLIKLHPLRTQEAIIDFVDSWVVPTD